METSGKTAYLKTPDVTGTLATSTTTGFLVPVATPVMFRCTAPTPNTTIYWHLADTDVSANATLVHRQVKKSALSVSLAHHQVKIASINANLLMIIIAPNFFFFIAGKVSGRGGISV